MKTLPAITKQPNNKPKCIGQWRQCGSKITSTAIRALPFRANSLGLIYPTALRPSTPSRPPARPSVSSTLWDREHVTALFRWREFSNACEFIRIVFSVFAIDIIFCALEHPSRFGILDFIGSRKLIYLHNSVCCGIPDLF